VREARGDDSRRRRIETVDLGAQGAPRGCLVGDRAGLL
jgi:hypothetical protein